MWGDRDTSERPRYEGIGCSLSLCERLIFHINSKHFPSGDYILCVRGEQIFAECFPGLCTASAGRDPSVSPATAAHGPCKRPCAGPSREDVKTCQNPVILNNGSRVNIEQLFYIKRNKTNTRSIQTVLSLDPRPPVQL